MLILDQTLQGNVRAWVNVVGKPQSIRAINRCFKDLEKQSILQELDLFHLIGGLDSDVQRLRPLITTSTTKTFTAVASPTLDRTGVTGNGSSSYLRLNWTPSIDTIKHTLNSASFGNYSRTDLDDGDYDMGVNDGTPNRTMSRLLTASNINGCVNNNSLFSLSNSNSLGLHSFQRSSSVLTTVYKNGLSLGTNSGASVGLPTQGIYLCSRNANGSPLGFTTRNFSMCFIGSGNIDQLKFYQIIQAYMSEVGLAV